MLRKLLLCGFLLGLTDFSAGCDCKPKFDRGMGKVYGCCRSLPRYTPGVVTFPGPNVNKPNNPNVDGQAQINFLNDGQGGGDGFGRNAPPDPASSHLTTGTQTQSAGYKVNNCNSPRYCKWWLPNWVITTSPLPQWTKVYQTNYFRQWVRWCHCSYIRCTGYMYKGLEWEAKCYPILQWKSLWVWVRDRYGWWYLRLRWVRFPSACCCGYPTKFVC